MKAWAKHFIPTSRGFTIVELLIVIVVIGMLAAILFVGYGAVQNNAHDTTIKSDLVSFGDAVTLKALDDDGIPAGGATSSLTGDSTQLSGIQVKPTNGSYDLSLNNLFYCSGDIDGSAEFAVVAKSKSGKTFAYVSHQGVIEVTGTYTWDYAGICGEVGFTAPYTWSYGYNPDPQYQWFSWAYNGPIITNLATNPSFETNLTGHAGARGVLTRDTSLGFSGTSSAMYVADGTAGGNYLVSTVTTGDISGKQITGSIRALRDETSASMWLRIYFRDATNAFIAPLGGVNGTSISLSGPEWTEASVSATAPAGTASVQFYSLFTGTQPNGTTFWFDGLMVNIGTETKFYDGSTFGWEWSGTAHASTSSGPQK